VRRGKIEETRFLLAITEVAEGFEIFRADHSGRISSMISGFQTRIRYVRASPRMQASPPVIAPYLVKEPPTGKSIKGKTPLAPESEP
jgi:hypothetical protein